MKSAVRRLALTHKTLDKQDIKIVQIVNTLSVKDGGPSRNSFELNKALNLKAGCSADLFWLLGSVKDSVLMDGDRPAEDLPTPGPRQLSLLSKVHRRNAGLRTFITAVKRADVMIIHGYYLNWVPIVAVIGKLLGCRLFLMPHGSLTTRQQRYSVRRKQLFDLLFGWTIRKILTCFVTGTSVERDELSRKFPKARIAVAGVGVPKPKEFRPPGFVHSPLRLLSMSRIAPKKRIDLSIDAVSELCKMGIDASLMVAGTGPDGLVQRLRERARGSGIEDNVSFVGQLIGDAKTQAFVQSDFFLLPSDDENFGIGFAEATSHGLPTIVSTSVAAAVNLPAVAGTLIKDPDGVKIALAIRNLMGDEVYQPAQVASRDYAVRHFSWNSAADHWLSILRD